MKVLYIVWMLVTCYLAVSNVWKTIRLQDAQYLAKMLRKDYRDLWKKHTRTLVRTTVERQAVERVIASFFPDNIDA
jgi:hypothetical protein